jgi:hypothetical protein
MINWIPMDCKQITNKHYLLTDGKNIVEAVYCSVPYPLGDDWQWRACESIYWGDALENPTHYAEINLP